MPLADFYICSYFQGDRTKNVGVVDSEYIAHLGLPTLGVIDQNKVGVLYIYDRSCCLYNYYNNAKALILKD